jgi:hypothetical protein
MFMEREVVEKAGAHEVGTEVWRAELLMLAESVTRYTPHFFTDGR